MSSYAELLKDPRWQRKRLERLDLAKWACSACESTTATLHVHHKQYIKGRKPWEYELSELDVLCADCHKGHHEREALLGKIFAEEAYYEPTVIAVAAGFLDGGFDLDPDVGDEARALEPEVYAFGYLARILYSAPRKDLAVLFAALRASDRLNPSEEQILEYIEQLPQ